MSRDLSREDKQTFLQFFALNSKGTWDLGEIFVMRKRDARRLFKLGIKIGENKEKSE